MPRSTKFVTLAQPAASATVASTVTKSEAIRQALAAGLLEPREALPWILEKYGITMNPQHFRAIRARIKQPRGGNPAEVFTAIETIKPLVARHGVENVKRMLELCK